MSKTPKTILTRWNVRTYDVWGNASDGYEVNDTYGHGEVEIRSKVETCNAGTPHEFITASPSDHAIKKVFGVGCRIDTDGDDLHITVNRSRDSYPIGELVCTSHASLSPIRPINP